MALSKFLLFIVLLLALICKRLQDGGALVQVESYKPPGMSCEKLFGAEGAEDLSIDHESGIAFVSATANRRDPSPENHVGALYTVDLRAAHPAVFQPRIVGFPDQIAFAPHGLSILREEGELYLFVINHRHEADVVEVFLYKDETFVYEETISSELFVSPNDLVAVTRHELYLTNDHGQSFMRNKLRSTIEDLLYVLHRSNVVYKNLKTGQERVVLEKRKFANGINITPDKKILILAETLSGYVHFFDRQNLSKKTGDTELVEIARLQVDQGADNIEITKSGDLLIGTHPNTLQFLSHAASKLNPSPTRIYRIPKAIAEGSKLAERGGKQKLEKEVVYADSGEEISAASVAALYQPDPSTSVLLMGPVFDDHLLLCTQTS